jgi:cardiolipin synthase
MIHSKAATFDGRFTIVGSANYDCRSFELNHELNLVIEDRELVGRMKARFEQDLESSTRITPADLARRPFWKRTRSRAALLLRSQL